MDQQDLDWALPDIDPLITPDEHLASDYASFERWIPDFERPETPCDYCRAKGLACYKRKDQVDCYACLSLFRECSLHTATQIKAGGLLDALHSVTEDVSIEQGSRTTVRYLNSKPDESRSRNGTRFPQSAVKVLREWYAAHQDHPYPTDQEKVDLETITGLKPHQVANWLANQRRKTKVMTKQRHRRCSSPSAARSSTPAIDITQCDKPWEELNPLERWQCSPPENEPARMHDIQDAIQSSDLPEASSPSSLGIAVRSSNGSAPSRNRGAASTTSAETSQTGSLSAPSSAAHSNGSSGSFGSFSSSLAGKKSRRRKRALPLRQDNDKRPFQCTFCTDRLKTRYDWQRHESSLHLALEKWICSPLGPSIVDASGAQVCVYCDAPYTPGHEKEHNHNACEEKGLDSRTFYRKDHLRQHLRLMHGVQLNPSMNAWQFKTTQINSRCGFCAQRFHTIEERQNHLSAHFRSGAKMVDWKGCRGFDPAVAAQVTNAMPPYLIGIEALSPNPFSASNEASMRDWDNNGECAEEQSRSPDDLPPKATCWEILTIRLGKFVNEMVAKNIVVTDEMLQQQARIILYGDDDQWHQTAADNETWLSLFKKGHGLSYIPGQIGGQGQEVPEDLEWYSDLGVRIPFFVQLEQYNKTQNDEALVAGTGGRARGDSETGIMLLKIYTQLLAEGVLHSPHILCPHQSCSNNLVDSHYIGEDGELHRRQNRWCNDTVTTENAQLLAKFVGLARSGVSVAPISQLGVPDVSDAQRAARARSACLQRIQHNEVACCPFVDQIKEGAERREEQLARIAALSKPTSPYETAADGSQYQGYHALDMPVDKAHHFATYRQASEDSGVMGPLVTSQDHIDLEMLEMVNRISPSEVDFTTSLPSTGIPAYSMLAPDELAQISLQDLQFDTMFDMNMDEL